MKRPKLPTARRVTELPEKLLREIGQIMVVFSAIEHELSMITFTLLRISTAEGRLAVARQNIQGRMTLIKQLAELREIALPEGWETTRELLVEQETIRDWLAHGVWSLDDDGPKLEISRGTWQPPGYHKSIDRKIIPAGAPIKYETLREATLSGLEILALLERLHVELAVLMQPSP
jgi:hypothetical protein